MILEGGINYCFVDFHFGVFRVVFIPDELVVKPDEYII